MIVVKLLLGLLVAWQAFSIFALGQTNRERVNERIPDNHGGGIKFGLACIGLILALGFLGLLLK